MIFKIAFRNIFKNKRRSFATITALGIGGLAMLLFGGFVGSIFYGVQTGLVRDQGHIHIYAKGYTDFGAVDPDEYSVKDYKEVISIVTSNKEINELIEVITPQIQLSGIAANVERDNSKLFIGRGININDLDKMRTWDAFRLKMDIEKTGLSELPEDSVLLGVGMARMLGLCETLSIPNCIDPPILEKADLYSESVDFSFLAGEQEAEEKGRLSLLAAASTGMPNIINVTAKKIGVQSSRALDNSYILMNFDTAANFINNGNPQATQVIVQLKSSGDLAKVKQMIQNSLNSISGGQEYEVLTFYEVDPSFGRVFGMFSFIFGVMSVFLGVLITVTVNNTVTLTIMERIAEVGTLRALGFKRRYIMGMFVTESAMMGVMGVVVSLLLTAVFATVINNAGVQWTPPSSADPITIRLMIFSNFKLVAGVGLFFFMLSLLSALNPARRSVKMSIVKALHYS